MRGERVAPWTDGPDGSIPHALHEFPRAPRFPRCRAGAADACERRPARALADESGSGALPQAACAWARSVWLPCVLRAPWMSWAQGVNDSFIGQIP